MFRLLSCIMMLTFAAGLHAQQIRINAPKFALLINETVLKELKLTAEQQAKLKDILADCLQEVDGQKRLVVRGGTDVESLEADCLKVLTDKQAKRLREAWLQNNGAMAITEEQLGKDLKVTPEQSKKAEEALQKMNDGLVEIFHSDTDRTEQLPKIKKLRAQACKEIESLLTKDQLSRLKALQGAKIEGLSTP